MPLPFEVSTDHVLPDNTTDVVPTVLRFYAPLVRSGPLAGPLHASVSAGSTGFTDLDAEHEELASDPLSAPQAVVTPHVAINACTAAWFWRTRCRV